LRRFCCDSAVTRKTNISDNIIQLTLRAGEIAKATLPGQFIQVKVTDDFSPLWPRPFSIFDTDTKNGEVSIILKIAGRGTSLLASKKEGDQIKIFGPLGNGFDLSPNGSRIIMAAGGVGLPPLYLLARRLIEDGFPAGSIVFISGARKKSELFDSADLRALDTDLLVCTDDGSAGAKGTVVDLLKKALAEDNKPEVYACGPPAMLKKIDRMLVDKNIPGFLSLEELMPCGYGICSGCAVRVYPAADRGKTDDNRDYHLKRICVEGPVFKAGEVMW
jgi:dihydroorotate dehydrogenase electron transfer subunit